MKIFKIKIAILSSVLGLGSCSNESKMTGKALKRTLSSEGIAARSLPEQASSNDGKPVVTLPPNAPFFPGAEGLPANVPFIPGAGGLPPVVQPVVQPAPPPCTGVVINNSCQAIEAIHRCRSNNDLSFYTNHIYPKNPGECSAASYLMEAQPYFYSLPGLNKEIIRWYRTGLSGSIQHYYLQPGEGEGIAASYGLVKEGHAFRISAGDFDHPRKVPLYRCVVNCARLGNHARCDQNMQWISKDVNCEGNGVGQGAILGFGIAP